MRGVPLAGEADLMMGALCAKDTKTRVLSEFHIEALRCLGAQVQMQLKLRLALDRQIK